MSEAEFIFRSMKTHQVLIIVVDTRILSCVADSLQERRFASIGPSNYKDAKVSIFFLEVIGITVAHHGGLWVWVKRMRGNNITIVHVHTDFDYWHKTVTSSWTLNGFSSFFLSARFTVSSVFMVSSRRSGRPWRMPDGSRVARHWSCLRQHRACATLWRDWFCSMYNFVVWLRRLCFLLDSSFSWRRTVGADFNFWRTPEMVLSWYSGLISMSPILKKKKVEFHYQPP